MALTPIEHYQQALQQGFIEDPAQVVAADALQQCFTELLQGSAGRGVYLWGPVGRGKTWLMDRFQQSLAEHDIPSWRQHFHHFMAWLHKRLFALTGTSNPLNTVAQELAAEITVLCFDEFFINDIGDAMLLGPLLQALFAEGLVLVATSNEAPLNLYANGFNRERVLPALQTLAEQVRTVHLDGGQDHRLHGKIVDQKYFVRRTSEPSQFSALFLNHANAAAQPQQVTINNSLDVLGASANVVWCSFAQLCDEYLSAQDYMALCQQFTVVLLSEVPALNSPVEKQYIARGTEDAAQRVAAGDRKLAAQSKLDNSVRRFIALVDECYEQNVPLYLEAAVPLDELYTEGALLFPFRRTYSRLQEMQRWPR